MSPAQIDVAHAARSRLMVPPPRLNLRRAASYNLNDKGPLSAISSSLSFSHLFSPPPSPGLPALVPRPRKSPIHPRPSRVLRLLLGISAFLSLSYVAAFLLGPTTLWSRFRPRETGLELVGQDEVPDFPTPVLVSMGWRRPKWTVSIPPGRQFPLSVEDYGEMCAECRDVAARTRGSQVAVPSLVSSQQRPLTFVTTPSPTDPHFIDVLEAQEQGLLPGHRHDQASADWKDGGFWAAGDLVGLGEDVMEKPMCRQTMTFVLESTDAGLGKSLMLLWSFYGLARKQGRSFFVDDSRWAYGKYTGIFRPPPVPGCRPPPRQQIIPCPAQASHLVVSAATATSVFPEMAGERLPGESGPARAARSRELFDLARQGFEALFEINDDDREHVRLRVRELADKALKSRKVVVGVHIRHGDRHPLEYQYRRSYIPSHVFAEKAQEKLRAQMAGIFGGGGGGGDGGDDDGTMSTRSRNRKPGNPGLGRRMLTVVASDDPVVYESEEFVGSFRAQEHIRLASKSMIQKVSRERPGTKYIDDTFGWEGGFFAAMFWNLGSPPLSPASVDPLGREGRGAGAKERPPASAETTRLRSLVGRSYAMDLAVLAGASDVLMCTASATGCRLLAVMMGWETAIEGGNWVNVDGEYGWSGICG